MIADKTKSACSVRWHVAVQSIPRGFFRHEYSEEVALHIHLD